MGARGESELPSNKPPCLLASGAELPFVIGGPPTPMDLWKLYRKHCTALFLQDKDPGSQQTRPRRHFDLASPLELSIDRTKGQAN